MCSIVMKIMSQCKKTLMVLKLVKFCLLKIYSFSFDFKGEIWSYTSVHVGVCCKYIFMLAIMEV